MWLGPNNDFVFSALATLLIINLLNDRSSEVAAVEGNSVIISTQLCPQPCHSRPRDFFARQFY